MTRNDYDVVMARIRIADLESRLSEHLRAVRSGRSLTILDGDTPIARIVPWTEDNLLRIRPPRPEAPRLSQLRLPLPCGFPAISSIFCAKSARIRDRVSQSARDRYLCI